jgi:hypothetical protein
MLRMKKVPSILLPNPMLYRIQKLGVVLQRKLVRMLGRNDQVRHCSRFCIGRDVMTRRIVYYLIGVELPHLKRRKMLHKSPRKRLYETSAAHLADALDGMGSLSRYEDAVSDCGGIRCARRK